MSIPVLDNSNFNETVAAADKPILIDFYADWCGPCKMVAPIVEEIMDENKDNFYVYKVNVDDSPEIASQFSVASIPTFVAFKEGKAVNTVVGVLPKQNIIDMINNA